MIRSLYYKPGQPMRTDIPPAEFQDLIRDRRGTLWVDFNEATGTLTIHVLDLTDKSEWVRTIKGRYERQLLEIFA